MVRAQLRWTLLVTVMTNAKKLSLKSWGAWVPRSVKHPTLGFGSGHDLTIHGFEPRVGLRADSTESAWDSLFLSFCPSSAHALFLSQNKQILNLRSQFKKLASHLALWLMDRVQHELHVFVSWLHHSLVVWPWESFLTSLCHSFLLCEMGTIGGTCLLSLLGRLDKMMHLNSSFWCQASGSPFYVILIIDQL